MTFDEKLSINDAKAIAKDIKSAILLQDDIIQAEIQMDLSEASDTIESDSENLKSMKKTQSPSITASTTTTSMKDTDSRDY